MQKVNIFIDYPITSDKSFQGLSLPQVLHDYLNTRDEVALVTEKDTIDILLVTNGGSQYPEKSNPIQKHINTLLNKIVNQKPDYSRYFKRHTTYEERLAKLIKANPNLKIVHRLDDRYRKLCKVYGYDETVKWINQHSAATVFQSSYCKSLYTKGCHTIFGFEPPIHITNGHTIYNGVDRDIFNENGKQRKLRGKYKILHVAATGMTRKGLGTVLEFAYLLKNNSDIQFYLAGKQADDPVHGSEIHKFSNVHQIPFNSSRDELAAVYRSCDVLLFPSIDDCSPNVVLEAMSCGLPVVAANSGGTPELIYKSDIKGGLLIDDSNPIYALKEVLENLDSFSKTAIDIIKKYHTKEVIGKQYLDLFLSLR